MYWKGAGEDLLALDLVEEMEHKKGCLQWYRICGTLPDKDVLDIMVKDHYTRSILTWFEAIEEELEELTGEMEEWRGNMQEGELDSTPKYAEVEEAEDDMKTVLERFAVIRGFVDGSPSLGEITVAVHPRDLFVSCNHRAKVRRSGRAWRAKEVRSILDATERAARALKEPFSAAKTAEFANAVRDVSVGLEEVKFPTAF
jgi:hypothetical protein